MWLPRVRITLGRLMVAVAFAGLMLGLPLWAIRSAIVSSLHRSIIQSAELIASTEGKIAELKERERREKDSSAKALLREQIELHASALTNYRRTHTAFKRHLKEYE